ncbi:MAG: BA14K family protein [Bauldia sp.]
MIRKHVLAGLAALSLTAALVTAAKAEEIGALSGSESLLQPVQYNMGNNDNRRSPQFERRGNSAFYNGHRGYRDRRPGYRLYNGFWFPPAAFIAGAIFGNALIGNSATLHVRWCYSRYRSYRQWDNTFQPLYGPRQICVSPYRYY